MGLKEADPVCRTCRPLAFGTSQFLALFAKRAKKPGRLAAGDAIVAELAKMSRSSGCDLGRALKKGVYFDEEELPASCRTPTSQPTSKARQSACLVLSAS